MANRIEVLGEARLRVDDEAVAELARRVLEAEGVDGALTVVLVDEPVIADLNAQYRGADGPTDVLSFCEVAAEWPDGLPDEVDPDRSSEEPSVSELGEMVVCPEVVRRYAREEGNAESHQMAWTIIHGVLHLIGYDHEVDHGEMRDEEQSLLTALGDTILSLRFIDDGRPDQEVESRQ